MGDRLNLENVGWGLAFIVVGMALAAERLGWWTLADVELAIVGPIVLILIGVGALVGSVVRTRGAGS